MAIIYETLRMYPIVSVQYLSILLEVTPLQAIRIPKFSMHPAKFTTTNNSGSPMHVSIPAGTSIVWNVPGLHYNGRFIIYVVFFTG